MSHETFLADAGAVWTRGEWLWEITVPGPAGNVVLRVSRRGTPTGASAVTIGSDSIPAHTPFARRLLAAPSMTQALWKTRSILGSSIPSYGQVELQNADGGLDPYRPDAGYRWNAATAKGYFCDFSDIQGTIGKLYDGKVGGAEFGVGTPVKVTLLGRDGDFTAATSERVYRGGAGMLELSAGAGDRTINFGSPAAVNLTGNMALERWMWLDTAPAADVVIWGWAVAGFLPWAIVLTSTRALRFACHVAGVANNATTAAVLTVKKLYHISVSVNGRDVTFRIWDEDARVFLADEVFVNAIASATRSANVGGTYIMSSASAMVDWWDDARVFNTARTKSEVEADRWRPYPVGGVPASCVHCCAMNDGAGTTVTDSSATAANGTIAGAGTSTWLPTCEGSAELAGTPKPDALGEGLVAPVLVDPIRYIYQVAGGGAVQSIVPDEGGIAHGLDANAASFRAFLTTTPAAGRALPYLARGLFRLGSSPTLPISALVQGYNGGTVGYANAAGTITRKLVTERGLTPVADPAGLDTASFTAYATASSAKMGIFLPRPVAIGAALDKVNAGAAGWWGYVRASTLFHVERFVGPAAVADYDFDLRQIVDITPTSPAPVVWEVVVRFAQNPVVLNEDQAAATFKGTAGWQLRKQEWQEERRSDEALRAQYPGAAGQSITIETCLRERADAGALADYILALVKGEKHGWMVRLRATGLQLKVGQTLTLAYTLQDGSQRAGLNGTRRYVILSTEDVKAREEVRGEVWG